MYLCIYIHTSIYTHIYIYIYNIINVYIYMYKKTYAGILSNIFFLISTGGAQVLSGNDEGGKPDENHTQTR